MSRLIDPHEQHARRLIAAAVFKPEPDRRTNAGRLSRLEVAEIKRRLLQPRWGLQTELARDFGVTRQAINEIVRGRTHRNVTV